MPTPRGLARSILSRFDALSLQEWHAPHSSTASNLCTCTAEWECESPRARSFEPTTEANDTRLSALDIESFLRARVALAACPAKPDCSASNCKMDVLHVGWKRESSRPRQPNFYPTWVGGIEIFPIPPFSR